MSAATPYHEYVRVLHTAHAMTEPAEAHGSLVGALCAVDGYAFEDWLAEILPEGAADPAAVDVLQSLFDATSESLRSADLRFELLHPGDDSSLEQRAQALGLWCNGFIYGLGVGGGRDPRQLPGDVGEIVRDLAEIALASVDEHDGEEVNEAAFAELVEFVRVGAQLVHEQLASARMPQTPRPPASATLH